MSFRPWQVLDVGEFRRGGVEHGLIVDVGELWRLATCGGGPLVTVAGF